MSRWLQVWGMGMTVSLFGCGPNEDDYARRCQPSQWFAGDREGIQGKVRATASCWLAGCPIQPWAPGAEGEIKFQMIDNVEGGLAAQSSNPAVLRLEQLPAEEVFPAHSCVPPLEVKVSSLAPGDADIIVLRDGEPYDRLPLAVRQPASIELDAISLMQSTVGDHFCAEELSVPLFNAKLFGEDGMEIGYARPGWSWEIDGQPVENFPFQQARVPSGVLRVTVRWGELSDTITVEGFPSKTLADPGFTCGD